MHIVVAWDITATKPRWDEINNRLRDTLKDYSWVRPLSNFYVVKIDAEAARMTIRDRLTTVAKSVTESVHIVISPAMAGGRYDGFLPTDTWKELNQRSDQ